MRSPVSRSLRACGFLAAAGVSIAVSACGTTPPARTTPGGRGGGADAGGNGSGSGGSDASSRSSDGQTAAPAVATGSPADVVVALHPLTYVSTTDPCAHVATTTSISAVPVTCEQAWGNLVVPTVPGQDLMTTAPIPRTARVAPGVDPTQGAAAATAFVRWQAFQMWAERSNSVAAMTALDLTGEPDQVAAEVRDGKGHVASVPPCSMPSAIRVTAMSTAAKQHFEDRGWPVPGDLAIVATYPPCEGVVLQYPDLSQRAMDQVASTFSAVNPGVVQTVLPFGDVWAITGELRCDDPALGAVCRG